MSNKYGKIFKLPSYHENANKNKQWRSSIGKDVEK